jgi:hypothetical protein
MNVQLGIRSGTAAFDGGGLIDDTRKDGIVKVTVGQTRVMIDTEVMEPVDAIDRAAVTSAHWQGLAAYLKKKGETMT